QIHLLKSSLPLHIIPVFIGLSLCGWDTWSFVQKLVDILRAFIICGTFFGLNRFTIKHKLEPLKSELNSLLHPSETFPEIKITNNYYMSKFMIIGFAAALFYAAGFLHAIDREPFSRKTSVAAYNRHGETDISTMLEAIREKHDLPALAAAVVVDGKII